MSTFVAIYGSLMLLASVAAGITAWMKNRDVSYWMTLSLLFPPLFLILVLMPRNDGVRRRRESLEAQEERELRRDDGDRVF